MRTTTETLKKTSAATMPAGAAVEPEEPERAGVGQQRAERDADHHGRQHERHRDQPPEQPLPGERQPVQRVGGRHPQQHRHDGGQAEADHSVNHSDPADPRSRQRLQHPAQVELAVGEEAEPEHPDHGHHEEDGEHGERHRPRQRRPGRRTACRSRRATTGRAHRAVTSLHSRIQSLRCSAISAAGTVIGSGAGCGPPRPQRRQVDRVVDGYDVHVLGQRLLEGPTDQEVDQRLRALGVGRPVEHAGVLHLAEAGLEQRAASSAGARPRGS